MILSTLAGSALAFGGKTALLLLYAWHVFNHQQRPPSLRPIKISTVKILRSGRIFRLEPKVKTVKPILDPLSLYSDSTQVDASVDMSEALPFVSRSIALPRG